MSQGSQDVITETETSNTDPNEERNEGPLEVIREQSQTSQGMPSMRLPSKVHMDQPCLCKPGQHVCIIEKQAAPTYKTPSNAEEIEALLKEKEAELREEYDRILEKEMVLLKERFDFILANEQTRASYMLREAHRERQEKITALRSQLECKNLAALMYVMCSERRRSKLEKLRIIRDYTEYINNLQDILTQGQNLILHLSRGYKTAARVDHEWRQKMKKIVTQFLSFIYHFAGGTPDTNQYFLDLPQLLKIETPIDDNPEEDPCDKVEGEEASHEEDKLETPKPWWQQLDEDKRPFVMFGDLSDLPHQERREILRTVKAKKTAPKKWKQYVFNEMVFDTKCSHLDYVKDMYPKKVGPGSRWECQTYQQGSDLKSVSKQSLGPTNRRLTGQSIDMRGNMGSLLKIIATANANAQSTNTTALLAARDSMEITSTTKLRERHSLKPAAEEPKEVVLAVGGRRRTSLFVQAKAEMEAEIAMASVEPITIKEDKDEEIENNSNITLGSIHHDSIEVILTQSRVPEVDHIVYERVCPMEKCKNMQVDSFMRSLPPYMRANPFTHFEHTFEEYETCSPEQLEILKQRLQSKKDKQQPDVEATMEAPVAEWIGRGVATQTSLLSISSTLPPCTCKAPSPSPASSNYVFDFHGLLPVKQAMDAIYQECLFKENIEFNRFKVIGQDSDHKLEEEEKPKEQFKNSKYTEIQQILREHPSLLEIFQAAT